MRDPRLLLAAKRALDGAPRLREVAFIKQLVIYLSCSDLEARAHLTDLQFGGFIVVRETGANRTISAGPNLDTDILGGMGIDSSV